MDQLTIKDRNPGLIFCAKRHGERIDNLSQLKDFHLFRLQPVGGRYVKQDSAARTTSAAKA
ncbi:MAG: hypothetical protein IPK95_08785 [Cellvibrionales bacterium]|nr:hypothetical protein [Cellvibrionales bacterium]